MKTILLLLILLLSSCNYVIVSETELQELLITKIEKAYFEGQKDAINGDVRIILKDSIYYWSKSCWDNGTKPTYNPTYLDSK